MAERSIATPAPEQKDGAMQQQQQQQQQQEQKQEQQPLPKLSKQDFKAYNFFGQLMEGVHDHLRGSWKQIYAACSGGSGKKPAGGMSVRSLLAMTESFCAHLTAHHRAEESMFFPLLATKMPVFREELEMRSQHKLIHEGVERLEAFCAACKAGEKEWRAEEAKKIMDSFGDVLWTHLDEEVEHLKAENMRKFWTLDEVKRLGFMR